MRGLKVSRAIQAISRVIGVALLAFIASIPAIRRANAQLVLSGGVTTPSADEMRRYRETAASIIRTAQLKAGDKVVIMGGPSGMPFMEELAIAAERLGGHAWLLITPERLARFRDVEKPAEFLGTPPTALDSAIATNSDLGIFVASPEQTLADQAMPADRAALANRSSSSWATIDTATRRRVVFVGLPQLSDTVGTGVGFDSYRQMMWRAIGADYDRMAAQGAVLKRKLEHARRVHVTSPEGTDLTFGVGQLPVVVQAGLPSERSGATFVERFATLPGGHVYVAMDSTAQGRIRAAADVCGTDRRIRDESIDIRSSMPENVHAATEEACVQRAVGSHRVSGMSIGLNPALEVSDILAGLPLNDAASGVVSLMFGGNSWFGGPNSDPPVWLVPLLHATVEVDGRVVVRNGKIVE